jgi:hypothetical protein
MWHLFEIEVLTPAGRRRTLRLTARSSERARELAATKGEVLAICRLSDHYGAGEPGPLPQMDWLQLAIDNARAMLAARQEARG